MIFKNSNNKPDAAAVNEPTAMAAPAADQNNAAEFSAQDLQDDQELARVLADIDSQVNANASVDNELMADLEKAGQGAAAETAAPSVSFEKIEEEIEADSEPIMNNYQAEELPTVEMTAELPTEAEQAADSGALEAARQEATVSDLDNQPDAASLSDPVIKTPEVASELNNLDDLRKKALSDLRPIVDKVELNDEESFDVLLLLIRETDDEALLPKAYEAARQIKDEARRAQALLDVIKEADYFKNKA